MLDVCYSLYQAPWLTAVMRFVSFWGNDTYIPVGLTIIVAVAFWLFKEKKIAVVITVAALIGEVIKSALKEIIARPRPGQLGCHVLVQESGYSMPSGHTVFYTIFFGLLAFLFIRKYWGKWWGKIGGIFSLIMVLFVGFSRIYLGAHWSSDVLVGYVLGGIILFFAIRIIKND